MEHAMLVVEGTRVARKVFKVGDVAPFRLRPEPAVLAPWFVLGEGEALNCAGLHHNYEEFSTRYAPVLASARRHAYEEHSGGETYVVGGAPNFYHFVTNYLGRLYYYRDGDFSRSRFVVAQDLPPHYYDFLALLGLAPSTLLKVPQAQFTLLPSAVIANLPHYMQGGRLRADVRAFQWLRERLVRAPGAGERRRVMLSRARAPHRRVLNEDELFAIAERHGFMRLVPEDYALAKLLEILGSTEILITPFGAGSTNSLFCPSACVLVELTGGRTAGKLNTLTLGALAGQRCVRLVGGPGNPEKAWQYQDLQFAPKDFELALKTALEML